VFLDFRVVLAEFRRKMYEFRGRVHLQNLGHKAEASVFRGPDEGRGQTLRGRNRGQNFGLEANLAFCVDYACSSTSQCCALSLHYFNATMLHHQILLLAPFGRPGIDKNKMLSYRRETALQGAL